MCLGISNDDATEQRSSALDFTASRDAEVLHLRPRAAVEAFAAPELNTESVVDTSAPAPLRAPRPNRFFSGAAPAGAVPVQPVASPLKPASSAPADQDAAFVLVDSVVVPRFSKMVKNMRLSLLEERKAAAGSRSSTPALTPSPSKRPGPRLFQPAAEVDLPEVPPRSKIQRKPVQVRPVATAAEEAVQPPPPLAPIVQGFRVVGDTNNRIIFLNLADLGLSPGVPFLRLGDQELVPIDGLVTSGESASSSPEGLLPRSPTGSLTAGLLGPSRRPAAKETASPRTGGLRDNAAKVSETQQQGDFATIM